MPDIVLGVDEGGLDAAACVNPQCSEYQIPKPMMTTLMPGEQVWCGGCQQACEVDWYQGLTHTIPAPPWEKEMLAQKKQIHALTALLAESGIDTTVLEDTP